jgi:hypothetical protein
MEAISQEAIAFLNAAAVGVGGSNESAFILYSFSAVRRVDPILIER